MNRIKQLYIFSAINQYRYSDGDYLCDDGEDIRRIYKISVDDYFDAIEELERQEIVYLENKFYDDGKSEFTYDGKAINHHKLHELIEKYKHWCQYTADVDIQTVIALTDEIRKYYKDEDLLNAIIAQSEGIYRQFGNTFDEAMFYYLSATDQVAHAVNGVELMARIFDMKYHDAGELLRQPGDFFAAINAFFKDLLDIEHYDRWSEMLPNYIKDKQITNAEQSVELFVTRDKDGYRYKGKLLDNISTDSDYFQVFSVLYELVPKGGFADYKTLEEQVRQRLPRTKQMLRTKLRILIQRNLTDNQNGFLRYAGIENIGTAGKPLLKTLRGRGIEFNNKVE